MTGTTGAPGRKDAAAPSRAFGLDLPGASGVPALWRVLLATAAAAVLSVAACALVARATVLMQPTLAGYAHFAFTDYAKLTVIGVVAAGIAWPVAAALWSRARTPLLVGAALVLVVSFAPDVWIWLHGQPGFAVAALAVMHVAVVVVTVAALVLIAPQRGTVSRRRGGA